MVIVLASVFVLSGAMVKSGLIDGLSHFIDRFGAATITPRG
jgi:di/tricarboxylate transporter